MSEIVYRRTPGFERDLKKLKKRFRTLDDDLVTLIQYLIEPFFRSGGRLKTLVPIEGGAIPPHLQAYKVKKFACQALKGSGSNSGLRLILVFDKRTNSLTFAELYFKGDQANESRSRWQECLRELDSAGNTGS